MTSRPLLPLGREFLGRLAAARSLAYPFFRGIQPRAALSGPPTDFDGHRPYLPGDDIRWIDWNLFARLGELYVKVFQVEEEVEVMLFVDASLSMTSPPGEKHSRAAAAAAALAYLALLTAHPVTAVRYAEGILGSRGPYRHMEGFAVLTEFLLEPAGGTGTDLRRALSPLLARRRRPVTVIALTDGFQREPLEAAAATVASIPGGRFVLVRLSDNGDLRPRLRGDVSLGDLEGEGTRRLLSDRTLERQLRERIEEYFSALENSLAEGGSEAFLLPVEGSFEEAFHGMLLRSVPAFDVVRAR